LLIKKESPNVNHQNAKKTFHIDLVALCLAVLITMAFAGAASGVYDLRLQEVLRVGIVRGPAIFAFMVWVAAGLPSYVALRYFRTRLHGG
jgi:hypothetical protein